jgi:hypothetical protein
MNGSKALGLSIAALGKERLFKEPEGDVKVLRVGIPKPPVHSMQFLTAAPVPTPPPMEPSAGLASALSRSLHLLLPALLAMSTYVLAGCLCTLRTAPARGAAAVDSPSIHVA